MKIGKERTWAMEQASRSASNTKILEIPAILISIVWIAIAVLLPLKVARADASSDYVAKAKNQFYNFLTEIASDKGIEPTQKLVLNSTIYPFDITAKTPYFNEELFRMYADRTFSGGLEGLQASSAAYQTARFSSQYRAVMNFAAYQIDQNHPEIQASISDLNSQMRDAQAAFASTNLQFEADWERTAAARGVSATSNDPALVREYYAQRATWFEQARYADVILSYSENIDRLNTRIDAVRRSVYTQSEQGVLDNLSYLSKAYDIARPWNAQTELGANPPLTDLYLADPTHLPLSMYDSSPLVFPVGNLVQFLSGNGARSFNSRTYKSTTDSGTDSWNASGGGSFLSWSLGGGGSGSSSFSKTMTHLESFQVSFKNVGEYLVDRSSWFNPGVLQDPKVLKTVASRRELKNLQWVSVSMIVARGLTMTLQFDDTVNSSDFSESAWNAHGGGSIFGISLGGGGGGSTSRTHIAVSQDGKSVTFTDDDTLCRVLGVRVEPFVSIPKAVVAVTPMPARLDHLMKMPAVNEAFSEFKKGKLNYIEFQKAKVKAATQPSPQP